MFEQLIKVCHTCIIHEIRRNINLIFYRINRLNQDLLDLGIFRIGCPCQLKTALIELPNYLLKLHTVCATKNV